MKRIWILSWICCAAIGGSIGLGWVLSSNIESKEPDKICPTCRPHKRSNRIKKDSLYCEQCYNEYEEKEEKQNWLDGETKARFHARIAMWKRYENKDAERN